jgi:hypothetical protein
LNSLKRSMVAITAAQLGSATAICKAFGSAVLAADAVMDAVTGTKYKAADTTRSSTRAPASSSASARVGGALPAGSRGKHWCFPPVFFSARRDAV